MVDLKTPVILPQQPRCPVLLLLDTSGSMEWQTPFGKPIEELNRAIVTFKGAVENDDVAALRVEVAIITFGTEYNQEKLFQNFVAINEFTPPQLQVDNATPMGEAIEYALDLLEKRMAYYKNNNIPKYQPFIFLITDGEPDYGGDDGKAPALLKALEVAQKLKEVDKKNKLTFFSIGVLNANKIILEQITPPRRSLEEEERVISLNGLRFEELFLWISDSLGRVSRSRPGQQVKFARTSALRAKN